MRCRIQNKKAFDAGTILILKTFIISEFHSDAVAEGAQLRAKGDLKLKFCFLSFLDTFKPHLKIIFSGSRAHWKIVAQSDAALRVLRPGSYSDPLFFLNSAVCQGSESGLFVFDPVRLR
jgi:hypothetical protein